MHAETTLQVCIKGQCFNGLILFCWCELDAVVPNESFPSLLIISKQDSRTPTLFISLFLPMSQ